MVALSPETIAALAAAAMAAGCLDAIAGGGGLVTLPALLLAGLDPVAALATNKLQSSFGTASSTLAFARAGKIDWRQAWPMAGMAGLGSVAGSSFVRVLPIEAVLLVMPALLIAVAVYFASSRSMGDADVRARLSPGLFAAGPAAAIGFYDGFFGPGAGSFYMAGFVGLLGYGAVRAIAHTKLLNLASNAGALAVFLAAGAVVWQAGLAMALGAFLGAQFGSRLALRHGAKLARPLLAGVACAVAVRLLVAEGSPWRALWRAVTG